MMTLTDNCWFDRMIRQSEGPAATAGPQSEDGTEKTCANRDEALWAPTGWVHVEKDIDFSDPKVRMFLFKSTYLPNVIVSKMKEKQSCLS